MSGAVEWNRAAQVYIHTAILGALMSSCSFWAVEVSLPTGSASRHQQPRGKGSIGTTTCAMESIYMAAWVHAMRALHAPQVSPEHTAASIGRLSHSRAKGVALCRACNEHLVNSFTHVTAQSCITFHRGHLPAAPPPMSAMRPAPRVSSPRADYCACSLQVPKGFLYKKITLCM